MLLHQIRVVVWSCCFQGIPDAVGRALLVSLCELVSILHDLREVASKHLPRLLICEGGNAAGNPTRVL
jgi:hypothetical protein